MVAPLKFFTFRWPWVYFRHLSFQPHTAKNKHAGLGLKLLHHYKPKDDLQWDMMSMEKSCLKGIQWTRYCSSFLIRLGSNFSDANNFSYEKKCDWDLNTRPLNLKSAILPVDQEFIKNTCRIRKRNWLRTFKFKILQIFDNEIWNSFLSNVQDTWYCIVTSFQPRNSILACKLMILMYWEMLWLTPRGNRVKKVSRIISLDWSHRMGSLLIP